jgi:hypothetical protein
MTGRNVEQVRRLILDRRRVYFDILRKLMNNINFGIKVNENIILKALHYMQAVR